MGLLSAFALMRPLSLLGAGSVCPVPAGRCAEPFWVRDFSGLGTWSPAIKIIARDQASFLGFYTRAGRFPTCTDASESA